MVQIISIIGFALLSELAFLTEAALLQESAFPNFVTLRYDVGADVYMRWTLGVVVAFEYLGVGLGGAAFVAFMARTTNPVFAATQFALFSALTAVPRTVIGAFTGVMVEHLGWSNFFFMCMALAVPGMLLLFKVAPWNANDEID